MTNDTTPLDCQRALFDVPDDIVFLNAASKAALLKESIRAGEIGVADKGRPWAIDEPGRYTRADDIRERFARLIGASGSEIAIQPAASYGIATAAKILRPRAGSKILMLEGQFPSNVYAWQNLARASGAETVFVPWPEDGDWTKAVLALIDENVSIAALPPCHWTDGATLDLSAISRALKSHDAHFIVDATQWVGAMPIDVKELRADFLVCAAYKWLLGPYGLSFMYAAPEHQNGAPLEDHLFNHGGVDSITSGLSYPEGFTEGARRFDAGQYLNLITLPMIQASLAQIEAWGIERVGNYLEPITGSIADGAAALGLVTAPPEHRAPHILGIRKPGGFPDGLVQQLEADNIFVSARGGAIRVSPYLFNTTQDGQKLLERIDALLSH